jgi:prepilin-type N-terminal cleavage/methylation domain-containing protein
MNVARVSASGFSLIELLVVTGLIAVVAGIAIPISTGMINRARANSAATGIQTVLQSARNRAVSERRNIQVNFIAPNRVTLERIEVPGPATTIIEDLTLSEDLVFGLLAGLPDTPDAFGADTAIDFTGAAPVMFTSDGSLIDANGDVANGSIFMARDRDATTARAITIFGVTGYLQTWQWMGTRWVR